jgi:predicted Zn-dependent protease
VALTKKIMQLTTIDHASVWVEHTVRSVTRVARDGIRSVEQGDFLRLWISARLADSNHGAVIQTNQLDETALRAMVARADALARDVGSPERYQVQTWNAQDTYPSTHLWHEPTVTALRTASETAVPRIIETVHSRELSAAGFVGVMARAEAMLTSEGITAYGDETDSEVSVTVRSREKPGSGWAGQAARDWTGIDPVRVATEAAEMCRMNLNPQALEPGRRTAILGPAAVIQLARFLTLHFDGGNSDHGNTGFSKVPGRQMGSRFNQRMFDARIQITSNPADPEGGFKSWFGSGDLNPAMVWVDKGVLKNLAYSGSAALSPGRQSAELPLGMRIGGGHTSMAQMIAQCEEGIYVNRFSDVDVLDMESGMLTGVTRDGCFLVRNGKIDRPVKNFRFLMSPFFAMNNLMAVGPSHRVAFGYAPPVQSELRVNVSSLAFEWPRRPVIVPPMMVRDFNFSSLADAV